MPVTADPSPAAGCERPCAPPSVGSFVTPFPDEIPFSILSRHHVLYAPCSANALLAWFLGSSDRKIAGSLPSGLDHFYHVAPSGLWRDLGEFLDRHTLLPYYRPFLNPRTAKKLASLPHRLELTTKDLPFSAEGANEMAAPRFCPACVREDVGSLGQPYWHRMHQVPGVLVCHKHGARLVDRCPKCGASMSGRSPLFLPKLACECAYEFLPATHTDAPTEPWQGRAMDLARFCAEILDAKLGPIDPTLLSAFYRNTLRDRGYYRKGPRSKFQLWQDLRNHYTPDFLGEIGLSTPAKACPAWFARLTIRSLEFTRHPLHHVLLLAFLFPKFRAFTDALAGFKAAGGRMKSLKELSRKKTRNAHDPKLIKKLRTLLLDERRSFRTVEKMLGVTRHRLYVAARSAGILAQLCPKEYLEKDAAILQDLLAGLPHFKVLKKHGVSERRVNALCASHPELAKTRRAHRQAAELQKHKEKLVRFTARKPNADQARLRKKLPRSYFYVHRHDKPWLSEHFPRKKQTQAPSHGTRVVDWDKRDIEMALKLRTVAEQLRNSFARPICLTKCGLLAKAGVTNKVYFYLERLPRTKKTLEKLIDTDESFNRRKIDWAIGELSKEGLLVTKSAVIQKVSLRRKFGYLVDEALDVFVGEGSVNRLTEENVVI